MDTKLYVHLLKYAAPFPLTSLHIQSAALRTDMENYSANLLCTTVPPLWLFFWQPTKMARSFICLCVLRVGTQGSGRAGGLFVFFWQMVANDCKCLCSTGSYVVLWRRGTVVLTAGNLMITRDPRFRLIDGHNLEIRNVMPQDAGDYVCSIGSAENKEQTHTLEILGELSLIKRPFAPVLFATGANVMHSIRGSPTLFCSTGAHQASDWAVECFLGLNKLQINFQLAFSAWFAFYWQQAHPAFG